MNGKNKKSILVLLSKIPLNPPLGKGEGLFLPPFLKGVAESGGIYFEKSTPALLYQRRELFTPFFKGG